MEVHGWNGHLHCLKLWRWPCVVLVMSQRCFVKFMKSVRQEAGMWTTSSFEETTGISTTLCHWHFLRGKGTKIQRLQESANFIKFIPLLLPWNLSSKSLQIHPAGKSPFPRIVYGELSTLRCPLPRHESGAVALEIAPLFNCMHFSGRNHGETERSERSERLFCPLKKHHIPHHIPIGNVAWGTWTISSCKRGTGTSTTSSMLWCWTRFCWTTCTEFWVSSWAAHVAGKGL